MAMKGKMEITIGVSVGSSIVRPLPHYPPFLILTPSYPQQIAVGVIPLLVVTGWIIGQDLTLYFGNLETIILFLSVILVNLLIGDGKSNWLEGLMLGASHLHFPTNK
jgi:Ca2+:H+ antiporter